MKERLSKRIIQVLEDIGKTADEVACPAYVVGGFVRDLILYRTNEDMDIVIEGDGIAFAKKYAEKVKARIHPHHKFGTAVVIFSDGFKIDVASARTEYYKSPASLPTVEMSSIKLDLYRRDFTINTLVIQLNADRFGTLVDFFGAYQDLKDKAVRVLHNLSLVEDPTRVFRAIRFEQRFGFTIGKLTAGLIKNAVKMDFVKQLSGRRVFSELRHILNEEEPLSAVKRMHEFNLLKAIHPSVNFNEKVLPELFDSIKKVLAWHDLLFLKESYMKWALYFMAIIRPCDRKISEEICDRLGLAQRFRQLFGAERKDADAMLWQLEKDKSSLKNSDLYRHLHPFKVELLLYMMAASRSGDVKRLISHYYTHLRNITISLTGKDLKDMGIKPGPIYGELLRMLLNARLNEEIESEEDEIAFVEHYLAEKEDL